MSGGVVVPYQVAPVGLGLVVPDQDRGHRALLAGRHQRSGRVFGEACHLVGVFAVEALLAQPKNSIYLNDDGQMPGNEL